MKKYLKYAAIVLVAVMAAGALGFYYVNKPKGSIARKQPDLIMSPQKLLADFISDEDAANAKYLDKIIEVSGKITSISQNNGNKITLLMDTGDPMSNVTCELNPVETDKTSGIEEGSIVELKGICTGMLTDVILVDCIILNN